MVQCVQNTVMAKKTQLFHSNCQNQGSEAWLHAGLSLLKA